MREVILVICWFGVLQSLLLGSYFISTRTKNLHGLFLGLALLFTGVRSAKSTLFIFNDTLPVVLMNIGFAAHAATGPMLFLHICSMRKGFSWSWSMLFHFLPAILIVVFSWLLGLEVFWYKGGYSVLLIYTLLYVFFYWLELIHVARSEGWERLRGVALLLFVFSVLFVAYFSNYILHVNGYITGPVLYAVLIVCVSFVAIRNNTAFTYVVSRKYRNLRLSEEMQDQYHHRIVSAFQRDKSYLNSDFSLQQLAMVSGVPAYEMSYVLNEKLKTNFSGLTNGYRVEEAKRILGNPSKNYLSIAAVAFDCGFNSLSSFNAAFKKNCGMTPSEFRKDRVAKK